MSLKFPISLVGKRISQWLGFGSASRSFDGVDDYITLPNTIGSYNFIHNDKVFSIAAWIKTSPNTGVAEAVIASLNTSATNGFLVMCDDRDGLYDNAYRIVMTHGASGLVDLLAINNAIVDTDWHHVVFTGDGIDIKCYVDGVLQGLTEPVTYTGNYGNAYADVNIARHANPTPFFFTGNLADIRIYDADIGATNIAALANGTDIQTNLVGHWLKDTDDVIDYSVNSNDGDNAFEPEYSTDSPNKNYGSSGLASRSFNGVNDYVDLGNIHNDTVFTVSAWIKRDLIDVTYSEGVIGKWVTTSDNDKHWLLYSTPNDHRFIINQTNNTKIICAGPTSISSNQWYHLAATLDGTNIKLYIDGSLVDTQTYDGTIKDGANNTKIGVFSNSNNNFFDGNIADVRYYDTDIGATEIANLAAGTDYTTNLVGHWLGNSNDLLDMSVNSNHGSHAGSQYLTDGPAS